MRYYGLMRSAYRLLRDFCRDEDGCPLVEFTILMPMFFMIMFGIIEWGNIFYVQNNMLLAARQAVRAVAVGSATDSGQYLYDLACGNQGTPVTPASPITGGSYTYTFTANVDYGCAAASSPSSPTYGTAKLTITTAASNVSIINYLGKIGGTLSATVVMQEEFVCPAVAPAAYTTSQKC
jgi:Flp pilus assembly protein TadG